MAMLAVTLIGCAADEIGFLPRDRWLRIGAGCDEGQRADTSRITRLDRGTVTKCPVDMVLEEI